MDNGTTIDPLRHLPSCRRKDVDLKNILRKDPTFYFVCLSVCMYHIYTDIHNVNIISYKYLFINIMY